MHLDYLSPHERVMLRAVAVAIVVLIVVYFAGLVLLATGAFAREQFPGQYAQVDPGLRQWFGGQQVPSGASKGMSCCSDSDGVKAEEDIRGGEYWATFTITNSVTKEEVVIPYTRVPPEAVLQGPFPASVGQPIVWWWAEWDDSRAGVMKRDEAGNIIVHIRCFKPGSGV